MSSIIVKGMRMPECCDVCKFSDWSNLHQTASCKLKEYKPCFADFSWEYRSKRADFCPLVALPDKHGDLIDRDELRAEFPEPIDIIDTQQALVHITGVWAEIDCADAVIEAEDG